MAVVLGSGLGAFADILSDAVVIPYEEIPGWPQSTAVGHAGKLVVGSLDGLPVAALSGRAHLYEGYTAQQAVFGIRTLGALGVQSFVLTNAAGGVNPAFGPGQLVLISDHINLLGANPLSGPNDDSLGPRFPGYERGVFEALSRDRTRGREVDGARSAGRRVCGGAGAEL